MGIKWNCTVNFTIDFEVHGGTQEEAQDLIDDYIAALGHVSGALEMGNVFVNSFNQGGSEMEAVVDTGLTKG